MEQELFENVASIVLFTEYTIISRENWTATFFILLTISSLSPSWAPGLNGLESGGTARCQHSVKIE